MLTDTALRNLKPKSLIYKVSDRDGMYVTVSTAGTVTFRCDHRLNGRRETLTIGRYGPAGISLALAREKLLDAKKAVAQSKSPANEKKREKRRLTAAKNVGDMKGQRQGMTDEDSNHWRALNIVFANKVLFNIKIDEVMALQWFLWYRFPWI